MLAAQAYGETVIAAQRKVVYTDYMEDTGKKREIWIDVLRVAAACAVVLLHTVTGVMDTADMSTRNGENTVFLIIMDLMTWSVPVFIMISGYLFLDPEKELTFGRMLTKYCKRVVLALFLFGIPYACLEQIAAKHTFLPEMLWRAAVMVLKGQSWSHMWYLYLILMLYLLTPLFRRILKLLPRPGVWSIAAVLILGGVVLPFISRLTGDRKLFRLPDDSVYVLYYLLGYLFVSAKKDELKSRKKGNESRKWLLVLGIGLLAVLIIVSRLVGEYSVRMAYNYPPTVLLAVLLMQLAAEWKPVSCKAGRTWLQPLASYSFTIYLIHPVFLNVFYKFLHITPLSFTLALSLPFFYLVTLFLSLAGAWILNHIPILRKYVL